MTSHRAIFAAFLLAAPLLCAQETAKTPSAEGERAGPPPKESFLVTLTLKITDHGKVVSDQSYTISALTRASSSYVRDGDRVPILTGSKDGNTDIQYIDVGTNIDVSNMEHAGPLVSMEVRVENRLVLPDSPDKSDPVIRNTHYSMHPAVPLGKATTVYSSTDATSGHKVEIQLLAQALNGQ